MSSHVNGNCFYACLVYIITVTCYGLQICTYRMSEETAGNQNDWKGFQKVYSAIECQEFCSSIPACIAVEYSTSSRSCYLYSGPTTLLYNTDRVFMSRKCTTVTPDTKSDFTTLHKTPPTVPTVATTTTTVLPVTTSPHTTTSPPTSPHTTTPLPTSPHATTSPPTSPHHTRTNRAKYPTTPKDIELPVFPSTYNPRAPDTTAQFLSYNQYNQPRNFQNAPYRHIFPQQIPYAHLPPYRGYPHHYPHYPFYPRQQQFLRTPKPEVKISTRAPSKSVKGRRGRLCFNKSKLPNIRFPDEKPKFALVPSSDSGKVSLLVLPPKSSRVVCLWVTYRRNGHPILHLPTANPNKAYERLEDRLQEFVGAGTNTGSRNNVQSMFHDGNVAFNGYERRGNRDYQRSTVLVPLLLDGGRGLFSETSSTHTTRSSPVPPSTTASPKVHDIPANAVEPPGRTNIILKENTVSSNYIDNTLISGGILPMPILKGKTKTKVNLTREAGSFLVGLSENASVVYLNGISRSTSESSTGSTQKYVRKIVRKLGSVDISLAYPSSSPDTTSSPITTRSAKNDVKSWPRDSPVKNPYPRNASENTATHSTTPLSNMKGMQSRNVPHVEKTTVHPLKEHTTYISTLRTRTRRRQADNIATSPPVPVRRRQPRQNRKWRRRRKSDERRWRMRRRRRLYGHVADKNKGKHPGRYARRIYRRRVRRLRSLRSVRHPSARRHQHRVRTLRLRKSRSISSKSRH